MLRMRVKGQILGYQYVPTARRDRTVGNVTIAIGNRTIERVHVPKELLEYLQPGTEVELAMSRNFTIREEWHLCAVETESGEIHKIDRGWLIPGLISIGIAAMVGCVTAVMVNTQHPLPIGLRTIGILGFFGLYVGTTFTNFNMLLTRDSFESLTS
ncbi:TPA: hypothetical protein QDB45_001705 [Burkholderia vietnamiensis]|nr:hypothetical protein [Burkholderia vietnamiensis]